MEHRAPRCGRLQGVLYRWQEFYDATRGRRMLELDDRAQAFAMGDERFNSRGEMGQELATVLDLPETHPIIVPLHPEQVSLLRWGRIGTRRCYATCC